VRGIQFLGLGGRDSVEEMQSFVDRHGLDGFDHLVDGDGALWERFGITNQPAWVFVDDDGTARTVAGSLDEAGLREELQTLADD
jgi:peroxiredoxin